MRVHAESALAGPSSWQRFVRAAKVAENESLGRWVAVNQVTIESQFARRALLSHRAPDMPLTTAALDQLTRSIVAALYPRRYALKNRERLNRLLMLLQLHAKVARWHSGVRLPILTIPPRYVDSPTRCEGGNT